MGNTIRPLILLLLLGLTGCGAMRGRCGLTLAAELPVRDSSGLPTVEAHIAGKPVRMLVATGLAGIALTPQAVARLGLRYDENTRLTTSGVGGRRTSKPAVVTGLQLGQTYLAKARALVLPAGGPHLLDPGVDGILGMSVLLNFDIDLDMPHRRIALYRGIPCAGQPLPMPGPSTLVETELTLRGLNLMLPVELDGVRRMAVLDTGTHTTVVPSRFARVPPAALAADRPVTLIGLSQPAVAGRMHRFDTLRVGSERFARPLLIVPDDSAWPSAIVVGMDFARTRRMFLSPISNRLYIQRPPPH